MLRDLPSRYTKPVCSYIYGKLPLYREEVDTWDVRRILPVIEMEFYDRKVFDAFSASFVMQSLSEARRARWKQRDSRNTL